MNDTPKQVLSQVQIEQMVTAFESHIHTVIVGLCVCHSHFDSAIVWQALVRAAGRCFSRGTKTDRLDQTLEFRAKFAAAFEKEMREHVPSIDKAFGVPPPANGNMPPLPN